MKRLWSALGLLIGLACLYLFLQAAASHWEAFRLVRVDGTTVLSLAMALVCYLLTYLLSARGWQLVLRIVGVDLAYHRSLGIVATSQIGKYLPGNVGQHVGRMLLARRSGVDMGRAGASIALEPIFLLAAACACSFFALDVLSRALFIYAPTAKDNLLLLAGGMLLCILVVFLVPQFRTRAVPVAMKSRLLLSGRNLVLALHVLGINGACLLLGSIALWLIVGAMSVPYQDFHPALLGVYAIAWLFGFVVPGAPAGLGVREALLILGLTPLYGSEVAVTSTAILRLTTVLGDGFTYLIGISLRPRLGSNTSGGGTG